MAINKVIYGSSTLLDLSNDTVTAEHLESGYTAHDASGEAINGTLAIGTDTSDATASASQILSGQTAYIATGKATGTMANRGAVSGTIDTVTEEYTVPEGYHSGTGTVAIDGTEQAKIIPANIKSGVTILGVQGSALTISLTPVTPSGINLTHYWLSRDYSRLRATITYEDATNTRSDEYPVVAGHMYLARFLSPYGARCQTAISPASLVDNTGVISDAIFVTPKQWYDYTFFTTPLDGYFIMYKDDTSNDSFQTECFEVTFNG